MKKNEPFHNKFIIAVFLFSTTCIVAKAQKLPNIQPVSIYASAGVKVDGNITEWNNRFQAYNRATDIYYTIANDDQTLYLAVRAEDMNVINRIIGGGITLTIQKSGKRKDEDGIGINYPITKGNLFFNLKGKKGAAPDTSLKAAEEFMKRNNNMLMQNSKWIVVSGVKGIDTLSVYNPDGFKAMGLFNIEKAYVYELAVPLKYLGLSVNNPIKFAYHLRVNGFKQLMQITIGTTSGDPAVAALAEQFAASANAQAALLAAPTDFWGEYTLAKNK